MLAPRTWLRDAPRQAYTVVFVARYFIQVQMVHDRLDFPRDRVEVPIGGECDILVVLRRSSDHDDCEVQLGGGSLTFICRRRRRFPLH